MDQNARPSTNDIPVVRCKLKCHYCAYRFVREFSAHDRFAEHPFMSMAPLANITVKRTRIRRTWYGRKVEVTEDVAECVKCPRCNGNTALLSRDPIRETDEAFGIYVSEQTGKRGTNSTGPR